ncbi:Membrane associated serine protease, rhomboid family [Lutibacter agarilyticus]|uniref:Membrane associated serine protease, rhomboid family n=1 Tax=Lutibacter agarilyticus TaxID=1109740 RepID=A0A238V7V1_9FLAO|nr:rhomboid family intramembrane serine protease [Lutibacter agarilyticus]SNR30316.1 Membrane associated serine protease, rhomboid family [Lutibacter agarilyticus]
MAILNDIKQAYYKANVVEKIIYVNVLLFLITVLFRIFIVKWFALPATFEAFIYKPWTLLSYFFLHQRLFHILSNLLVLYYVGNLFLDFYTKKQFLNFYFLGGLFGGLVFLSYYYVTNSYGAPLIGASAAVTTIFVAIATKIPRYNLQLRFIGSVELWVLAAIWVVLSILQLAAPDKGGAIAHLGGAIFGFVYAKQLEKGNDIGKWFEAIVDYFANLFKPSKKSHLKTVYKSKSSTSKTNVEKSKQRKIDDILDKISKSGYESLTQEEKDFLFRVGKK